MSTNDDFKSAQYHGKSAKENKTRTFIIDEFKKCLSEDELPWTRGWKVYTHHNPSTNTVYRGNNAMILNLVCNWQKYDDPRWLTFNQIINDDSLHLKKGSKGVLIEYWSPYDIKAKKILTNEEAKVLLNDDDRKKDVIHIFVNNYYVFNGSCIEGMEPWLEKDNENYFDHEKHPETALAMNVLAEYLNNENISIEYHGDKAYYDNMKDKIVMPDISMFDSPEMFLSTQAHEISHSTGHEKRLNRQIRNMFGSEEYAQEELVAEISSAFLLPTLGVEYKETLDANKAYVQSWIQMLEDKPKELFIAITAATVACEYVLEKGNYKENLLLLNDDLEIESELESDFSM